jgi:hypothetical protein
MGVRNLVYYKVRGVPLRVIGICGLVGVLVDIDHPISYWFTGYDSRAAHIPLAIICFIMLCSIGAYCGRLYFKMVLKRKKENGRDK